jgi:hypothetical protein
MLEAVAKPDLLVEYGANQSEIDELVAYTHNAFAEATNLPALPLADEPHVAVWREYAQQAETIGVFAALSQALVQIQFPIQAGISQTEDYRIATRKGGAVGSRSGLTLQAADQLQLLIHPTLAGAIPVMITGCRSDFVTLVQALTKRNEPDPVPDSMGAVIIGGYNNWDRVRRYRQAWEAARLRPVMEADWQAEFQRLIPQKSLYQDRFILLSRGEYSAVPAIELGLAEADWLGRSLTLRLEHECCHYLTRRVFGSMRNNALDELIADYQGMIAANQGQYCAAWFLRFVGLESFPQYREGGRLQNYRGEPALSDGAFVILQRLVKDAAENLERFNHGHLAELQSPEQQAKFLMLLTSFRLQDLASDGGRAIAVAWERDRIARI